MSYASSELTGRISWRDYDYERVYCGLCGTYLTEDDVFPNMPDLEAASPPLPGNDASDEELQQYIDWYFLLRREEEMVWLGVPRLIGSNPSSSEPLNVFNCGGTSEIDGSHFYLSQNVMKETGLPRKVRAYYRREGFPFITPLHEDCYTLLCKYLKVDTLDDEVLHDTFLGKTVDDENFSVTDLALRYCSTEWSDPDNSFPPRLQHLALSPVDIPALEKYYRNIPCLDQDRTLSVIPNVAPGGAQLGTTDDPFRRLPRELVLEIAGYLDIYSFLDWRAASRVPASIPLTNTFWRLRVRSDMPWLYDIPTAPSKNPGKEIDWGTVFRDLWFAAELDRTETIHAIANRVYIWQDQCPKLAKTYLHKLKHKGAAFRKLVRSLPDVVLSKGRCMLLPFPVKTSELGVALLETMDELRTAEPVLTVSWTKAGELAGLNVITAPGRKPDSDRIDDWYYAMRVDRTDEVPVPRGDWITGLSFSVRDDRFMADTKGMYRRERRREVANACDRDLGLEAVTIGGFDVAHADEDDFKGYMEPYDLGIYERVVCGVQVQFAKGAPVELGAYSWNHHLLRAYPNYFVVGMKVTRQTATGTVSRVSLVQAPIRMYEGSDRAVCA
ncbi:DNA replication complex GINS PSF2 [Purpureocillium lavendulum]|uniref:DNA replication complex GINS PSF2 n=1 Tax=Purpureocillium lavendulum TaxID=1247861 RepID=A0AB34G8F1_9HYPO|nr:DNA replication complex GINS PSF2 [Purpureocillium lavendulum]